jgi:membrane associated rhomboid family serine protease
VDPCGDERRSECFSALKSFTIPISFIQIVMLIVSLAIGGVIPYRDNPAIGPGGATFVLLGAKDGLLIQQGQVWRLITPMFLHAGCVAFQTQISPLGGSASFLTNFLWIFCRIFHLLFNLLAQLRFGIFLERKWGTAKYAGIYVVSGIGASLMSCLLRPNSISVGASGALVRL